MTRFTTCRPYSLLVFTYRRPLERRLRWRGYDDHFSQDDSSRHDPLQNDDLGFWKLGWGSTWPGSQGRRKRSGTPGSRGSGQPDASVPAALCFPEICPTVAAARVGPLLPTPANQSLDRGPESKQRPAFTGAGAQLCYRPTLAGFIQNCPPASGNGAFGRPDSPTGLPAEPSQHRARHCLVTVARVARSSRRRGRVGV